MLAALLIDFQRMPAVAVETMLGSNVRNLGSTMPGGTTNYMVYEGEEKTLFYHLAGAADWTLVMAPEFDDILPTRLRWVKEANGRSLNSTVEAAALAGDKLHLAERLRDRGVPTPLTVCWPTAPPSFPAVCKPRFGAGSQATFLIHNEGELQRTVDAAGGEGWGGDLIVQPFIPGEAVSVSFLIGRGRRLALPASAHTSPPMDGFIIKAAVFRSIRDGMNERLASRLAPWTRCRDWPATSASISCLGQPLTKTP